MKSLMQMVGLPVVCGERRLGFVQAVSLSSRGDSVIGLNMQRNLHSAVWIPEQQIRVLGQMCVVIEKAPFVKAKTPFKLGHVCDTSGLRLGFVTDAQIDELTRMVETIEVSFGPIDDLLYGRRLFKRFTVDPLTGDVVVPSIQEDGISGVERGKLS